MRVVFEVEDLVLSFPILSNGCLLAVVGLRTLYRIDKQRLQLVSIPASNNESLEELSCPGDLVPFIRAQRVDPEEGCVHDPRK